LAFSAAVWTPTPPPSPPLAHRLSHGPVVAPLDHNLGVAVLVVAGAAAALARQLQHIAAVDAAQPVAGMVAGLAVDPGAVLAQPHAPPCLAVLAVLAACTASVQGGIGSWAA